MYFRLYRRKAQEISKVQTSAGQMKKKIFFFGAETIL